MTPDTFGTATHSSVMKTDDLASFHQRMRLLGYAGLLPFVALSLLVVALDGIERISAAEALVSYGAVILSFLGASHWGVALTNGVPASRLYFAVIPALLGWVAIMLPLQYGLLTLIAGLSVACVLDRHWYREQAWYCDLRGLLTAVVLISLVIPLIALS